MYELFRGVLNNKGILINQSLEDDAVGRKVCEDCERHIRHAEITKNLFHIRRPETFALFDFQDDGIFDDKIDPVRSDVLSLKLERDRNLFSELQSLMLKRSRNCFLKDGFAMPYSEFIRDLEEATDDPVTQIGENKIRPSRSYGFTSFSTSIIIAHVPSLFVHSPIRVLFVNS
jgi:hypothetical protein